MAVVSQNIFFAYKNCDNLVLNDVNLIVKRGEIYGLIGPSGCGKTTFLKTITGLCKPDFGTILVFGYPPGAKESGVPGVGMGYMPQELAVQNDLTIDEILCYYARIYCLSDERIRKEIDYWVQILALPEKSKLISNMSDGQKRRLSFAIALIHKPRLILVDEPTAGVDPILSATMWELLEKQAQNNGSSIIITTHYFSEAKRAHFIAFMRKGQILEKGAPQMLLDKYNFNTIDELFVALSSQQNQQKSYRRMNSEFVVDQYDQMQINELRENSCAEQFKRSQSFDAKFKKIKAIILKYLIQTKRNPVAMLTFFVASIFTTHLTLLVNGNPPQNLPVAWVVDELKPILTNVNNTIESLYLPEIFKNSIDSKTIELKSFSKLEEANESMKKGLMKAVLYFGPNFTDFYLQSDPSFDFSDEFVDNETLNEGSIHFQLIEKSTIVTDTVYFAVLNSVLKFREKLASLLGVNPLLTAPIIQFEESKDERVDLFGSRNFLGPGYLLYFTYFSPLFISSTCVSVELKEATFGRSVISGVTIFEMLLAQTFAHLGFASIATLINFFSTIGFTQLTYPHESFILILSLLLLQTIAGIINGMLIAILVNNSMLSLFIVIFLAFSFFITNNVFMSIQTQPYYIKWFNYCLPLSFPSQAIRNLMSGDNSLFNPLIWQGFVLSLVWILLPFILCLIVLKIRN